MSQSVSASQSMSVSLFVLMSLSLSSLLLCMSLSLRCIDMLWEQSAAKLALFFIFFTKRVLFWLGSFAEETPE